MITVSIEHSRPVPQWAEELVSRLGSNPYGGSTFRLIWAPESKEIIGGFWHDTNTREYRETTKYPGLQRFVLERWCPPSAYGEPEAWDRMQDAWGYNACGPYPYKGSYEHAHTFEVNSQYVPLDPTLVRLVIAAIQANKLMSTYDRLIAIRDAKEAEQKALDRKFDDIYDDAKIRFFGATVGYGSRRSDNKIDNVRLDPTKALPHKIRKGHSGLTQL